PRTAVGGPPPFHAESAGLISLLTDYLSLSGAGSRVSAVIAETDALLRQMERLKYPLNAEIRNAIRRSDELTNDTAAEDVRQSTADQRQIDALAARFRQLSTAM